MANAHRCVKSPAGCELLKLVARENAIPNLSLLHYCVRATDVIWRKGKRVGELALQDKLPAEAVNVGGGWVPELFIKHANVFVGEVVFVENQAFASQDDWFISESGEEIFGGH